MIEFILPFPPSVNGLYVNAAYSGKGRRPGRFYSKSYQKWVNEASIAMRQQHPQITPLAPKFTQRVEVSYNFSRPDKRIRDLSNHFKAIDDFMVKWGVLLDDNLIERINAEWVEEGNGVFITVRLLVPKT